MTGGFPYERLVAFVERRHRALVAGATVVFLLSGLSLLRLRLDMDVLSQLPQDSAAFADYARYLRTFGPYDTLLVLVTGDPARLTSFADALAEKLRALPEVGAVRHRVDLDEMRQNYLRPYRWRLLTDEDYAELSARLAPERLRERVRGLRRAATMPMSLGARRWLVEDPLGVDELLGRSLERRYGDPLFRPRGEYLLAPSGDALLVVVRPVRGAFDTVFAERLLEQVHAAEEELLRGPFAESRLRVGHTGSYVYAVADRRTVQRDMRLYFLFAPLAVLAVFHWGLRTLRILPFVTFPLLVTTALTFALSLWAFHSLNMLSVAFAGIFYGLGIDSSIYFYALLRVKVAALGAQGAGLRKAVTATLRELGAAIVIASVTTAVAFFVIGCSDFTGVSQLGLMTAVAMLLNIASTFVLLPALVFWWGERAVPDAERGPRGFGGAYAALAPRLAARRGLLVAAAALLVAISVLLLPRVRLDTDFTHLRPGGGEAAEVEEMIRERFGRLDARGIVVVEGTGLDAALGTTERVAAALERYRTEGLVTAFSAITAFVPSAETAAHRLALFRALPRKEAAGELRRALADEGFDVAAFATALAELEHDDQPVLPRDPPDPDPLAALREQHVRRDGGVTAVSTTLAPAPGVSLASLRDRLLAEAAVRTASTADVAVTGRELIEAEFRRLLERELWLFLGAAVLLNLGVVLAAERSLLRALALLAPTLLALLVYLGTLGLFAVPIDPVNLIVLPLLIGLGVDDSVYLVAHVRHTGSLVAGSRRGFLPLLLAVTTTVVGFGSLGLSRFPALARLGWLAAYGLALCVVFALLLVPVILPARSTAREGEAEAAAGRRREADGSVGGP